MESRFRPSIMKLIISSIISDILMPTEAYQCAVINARRIGIIFFLQDMCAILYVFFLSRYVTSETLVCKKSLLLLVCIC